MIQALGQDPLSSVLMPLEGSACASSMGGVVLLSIGILLPSSEVKEGATAGTNKARAALSVQ